MTPLRVALAVGVLCVCAAAIAHAKDANVVLVESHLPLEYSDVIHEYAWAAARPDPHYHDHHTAYNIADDKNIVSFLEMQTHVSSKAAAKTAVKAKLLPFSQPKGFYKDRGYDKLNNPAESSVRGMSETPSDFTSNPPPAMGPFPGATAFRRAVYGVRRRRIPYYMDQGTMASLNPFRRPNSWFNTPQDLFKVKDPFYSVKHPEMWDYGRQLTTPQSVLPYGGYSSFRAHNVRRAVSEQGDNPYAPNNIGFGRPGAILPFGGPNQVNNPVPFNLNTGGFTYPYSPAAMRYPNGFIDSGFDSFLPSRGRRWDGDKFSDAFNPTASGPSPFVGDSSTFIDFYGPFLDNGLMGGAMGMLGGAGMMAGQNAAPPPPPPQVA